MGAKSGRGWVLARPWLLALLLGLLGRGRLAAQGSALPRSSQCVPVPKSMALCYGLGYTDMRLPNLLEHETVAEATQQASSWLPLLARECHPDARILLCSLLAPVCLDSFIYPCRSLCEAVRSSCAPIMECYGYPWPEILNCAKFPADHNLCIAAVTPEETAASRRAVPRASCNDCELQEAGTTREVLEGFCASDFTAKIRISRRNATSTLASFSLDTRVEMLKHGPLLWADTYPKLQQWLDLDATCVHNIMRGTQAGVYVVSGTMHQGRLVVNKAYDWHRRNRALQLAVRRWKQHRCRL
ncbi:secreted frizzled-related protein 5-like [Alligator sinensis]|uniref:Secreted frizzled-related protein 1 n=1 Tax=Alligator sinensis TaxID=38654 RepID=A0A1U7RGL5_ALLSI|nr:secreted frizzled-related protein 5-like [Alligator sinensis]